MKKQYSSYTTQISIFSLLLLISFSFLLQTATSSHAITLGGRNTGFSIALDKDWAFISKEKYEEIAKVLVEPYDPDGKAKLIDEVQAAVSMGQEPSSFKQITAIPIPYKNLPLSEETKKKLSVLDKETLLTQKRGAEEDIQKGGMAIASSGIFPDGYWILVNVDNTIFQKMQMRFTKKGALMVLIAAAGTDKKAETTIKKLEQRVIITPSNRIKVKNK